MIAPSFDGLTPRSLAWIAFSIALIAPLSYGEIVSTRGSGTREPGDLLERDLAPVEVDLQLLDERRASRARCGRRANSSCRCAMALLHLVLRTRP